MGSFLPTSASSPAKKQQNQNCNDDFTDETLADIHVATLNFFKALIESAEE